MANHLADGASVDSQIYEYMASVNASLVEKTRIVEVLPSAPTGPVVMRSDLDPERRKPFADFLSDEHGSQTGGTVKTCRYR